MTDLAKEVLRHGEAFSSLLPADPRRRWRLQWASARTSKKGGFYSFLHATATRQLDIRDDIERGRPVPRRLRGVLLARRVNRTMDPSILPVRVICALNEGKFRVVPVGSLRSELFVEVAP